MELNGKPPKVRHVTIVAPLSSSIAYGVHNPDIQTAYRGVLERVFYVKSGDTFVACPRPEPGKFNQTLRKFKQCVARYLPETAPISHHEFVDLYEGRRRTIYAQACESVLLEGCYRKHSYLNTFVKAEKVNFTAKPDPAPRIIQPRNPRYNLCVGRFIKPLEHKVYHAIDKVFKRHGRCQYRTVAKCLNVAKIGSLVSRKWNRFHNPRGLTFDAARFDQHTSVDALKFEHGVYLGCFKGRDREELTRLLLWQLRNRGFVRADDGSIEYETDGCRMSGDMNTAVGNVVLMSGMMYCYLDELGIDYELVNNGDDSLLIVEASEVDKIARTVNEFFLPLGYEMKLEGVSDTLESCQFCQTRPVWTSQGYRMCRTLDAFSKDCVSLKPFPTKSAACKWFGSIGDCGMALAGDIPIFSEFYRAFLRLAGGARMGSDPLLETGMFMLAKGMRPVGDEVLEQSRYSFYLAFGVLPGEQRALEELYRNVDGFEQLGRLEVLPTDPRYLAGRLRQHIV